MVNELKILLDENYEKNRKHRQFFIFVISILIFTSTIIIFVYFNVKFNYNEQRLFEIITDFNNEKQKYQQKETELKDIINSLDDRLQYLENSFDPKTKKFRNEKDN